MRNFIIPALAAVALIAGCNSSNSDAPVSTAATKAANGTNGAAKPAVDPNAPIPGTISGTANLRDPITLGPQTSLELRLVDVAQPQIAIATTTVAPVTQMPANFSMTIDPSKIDRTRTYVVDSVMTDGQRRFMPALQSPVLTQGAGNTVNIVLAAEATPGEKLKEEYNKLQARIGGMTMIKDTYETADTTVGWDAFIGDGYKIRFAREITDMGDKGRTNIKYAFKDDKPMFVVKQEMAGAGERPTSTVRVGWNDAGEVILNEQQGGGEISADAAKNLHDRAQNVFKLAQAKAAAKKR